MTGLDDDSAPTEPQVVRLTDAEIGAFEEWATDGTALAVAARVTDPTGRIALVKNAWSDGWTLPGGGVESGESVETAAAREIREETGLEATVEDVLVVLDQLYVPADTVPDGTDPGAVPQDAVTYRGDCVVVDAAADGAIPPVDDLGIAGETIRAARWFEELPERFHDGDLLRPYLVDSEGKEGSGGSGLD